MSVLAFMNRPRSAGRKVCPGGSNMFDSTNSNNENSRSSNLHTYLSPTKLTGQQTPTNSTKNGIHMNKPKDKEQHGHIYRGTTATTENSFNRNNVSKEPMHHGRDNTTAKFADAYRVNKSQSPVMVIQKKDLKPAALQRPKSATNRNHRPPNQARPKSAAMIRPNPETAAPSLGTSPMPVSKQGDAARYAWQNHDKELISSTNRDVQETVHLVNQEMVYTNHQRRPSSGTTRSSNTNTTTKSNPICQNQQHIQQSSTRSDININDFYAPEGTIRDDGKGFNQNEEYKGFTYDSPQRREQFMNIIRHLKNRIVNLETSGRKVNYPFLLSKHSEELCPPKERHYLQHVMMTQSLDGRSTTDFYVFGKVLGQGSFAKVRVAWHKLTGRQVAIKTYEKARLKDANQWRRIQQEIRLMEKINNPLAIRMYECIESPKRVHIVMEYLGGSNLCSYVKSKRRLCEDEARSIFRQLIDGIEYIHNMSIIHRDIKLENVLFDENRVPKIVDFGFGVFNRDKKLHVFCGTPSYMAPEIVKRKEYDGTPVDIWSLGVVLYALLVGRFPFCAKTYPELYKRIARGFFEIPAEISDEAKHLIQHILEVDSDKRYTIKQIRDHPWMKRECMEKYEPRQRASKYNHLISENPRDDLNDQVLRRLEKFGLNRDVLIKNVLQKRRNSITTVYYLLKLDMEVNGLIKAEHSSAGAQKIDFSKDS